MAKLKKVTLFLFIISLILATIAVSYAAYSVSSVSVGSVTAKSFNLSHSVQKDIPIEIWLGETRYYYFDVENCNAKGKVSDVDLVVNIAVKLRAFEDRALYSGLKLTLEENVGAQKNAKTLAESWQSITDGVFIITDGVIEGESINLFPAGQRTKRQFRIKYNLPDTAENAQANGFYTAEDTSLLNIKSAVDLEVKINQDIK